MILYNNEQIAYKKLDYINNYFKIKRTIEMEENKWTDNNEKINKLKK